MKTKNRPLPHDLLDQMIELRNSVYTDGRVIYNRWKPNIVDRSFRGSAKNLAYYLALRRRDIRELQEELSTWGLSSLGRLESRTLPTIDTVIATLAKICNREDEVIRYPKKYAFAAGHIKLRENIERLFGSIEGKRNTHIMVTVDRKACNYDFVKDLSDAGMTILRINCAHEDPEVWLKIINNAKRIREETGRSCKVLMDISGPKARTSWVLTGDRKDRAVVGKRILISKHNGSCIHEDDEITLKVGCSLPEILDDLKIGEPILIDDGKIESVVEEIVDEGVIVRVNKTDRPKGFRIKAYKGLNFPKTNLNLPVITEKDHLDLDFVVKHADIIGFSFIKNLEDMRYCLSEVEKRIDDNSKMPSIVAKIETQQGIANLSDIIAEAGGRSKFGVMIARGDLAVETGYLRLAELQQQILWLCEAADIPCIWATEVLANMCDTGIPTRSEVTDAAEGGARAECVMLNKGDYIVESVEFLRKVLEQMESNLYKKTPLLRALSLAKNVEVNQDTNKETKS